METGHYDQSSSKRVAKNTHTCATIVLRYKWLFGEFSGDESSEDESSAAKSSEDESSAAKSSAAKSSEDESSAAKSSAAKSSEDESSAAIRRRYYSTLGIFPDAVKPTLAKTRRASFS